MGDGMRAIPLKRPRAATSRAAAPPLPVAWQDRLTENLPALASPRPLWLATLGLGAIVVRAVATAWSALVEEGAQAEADLQALLARFQSTAAD
jgi:hypothetical protein